MRHKICSCLYVLISLSITLSCKDRGAATDAKIILLTKNDSFFVVREYHGDTINKDIRYSNDSVYKEVVDYYPNGMIKEITNYRNDVKNGIYRKFYPDGWLEYQVNYKNGYESGGYIDYYENGTVRAEGFKLKGVFFGESYSYYPSGKMESWTFGNGECISYARTYDTLGNIIKEKGDPIFIAYNQDGDSFSISQGDTLKVDVRFAQFKNWKEKLILEEMYNNKVKIVKSFDIPIDSSKWFQTKSVEKSFNQKGVYKWIFTLLVEDTLYKKRYKFGVDLDFKVGS